MAGGVMEAKFDHRIHILCAPSDIEQVRTTLENYCLDGWDLPRG